MTTRINPIAPRLKWDVLDPSELERIHEATLRDPRGRRRPLPQRARARRARGGRLRGRPRHADREAAAGASSWRRSRRAPREYRARRARPRLRHADRRQALLSEQRRLRGLRLRSQDRREAAVARRATSPTSARFVDALPNLSYYWGPVVTSQDVPPATKALHDAEAVFANTSKHFQTVTTVGEKPARYVVEMAAAIAGGTGRAAQAADPQLHAVRGRPARLTTVPTSRPTSSPPSTGWPAASCPCRSRRAPARPRWPAPSSCRTPRRSAASCCCSSHPRASVLLRRRAERHRPADRRLHRRLARGLPARRRLHAARALLRPADGDGHHGDRRQGARLAGRRRRLAQHVRQRHELRRHDERRRPAQRLQDPQLPAPGDGERDLRHRRRRWPAASTVDDETLALDVIESVGPNGTYLAESTRADT